MYFNVGTASYSNKKKGSQSLTRRSQFPVSGGALAHPDCGYQTSWNVLQAAVVVACMGVSPVATAGGAVLMVEEDEADGERAEDEEAEREQAQLGGLGVLVHPRHALGRADLDVDAAAKGEHHTLRVHGGLRCHRNDDA